MQTQYINTRPLPSPVSSRHDLVKLCTVEVALILKDALGPRIAAEFLRRHQIDLNVALRVLLRPQQRRQYAS